MDLFIHYNALPDGLSLEDVVDGLNEVMEDGGVVCGGLTGNSGGRIDMELEEEKMNPKLAQSSVKAYVQRMCFPRDTTIELGGMVINAYE